MNIIPINLNFQFDEGNETTPIIIIATDEIDVNIGQIMNEIMETHSDLYKLEYYGELGCTPETLMNYYCLEVRPGWSWYPIEYTVDLN
jgi:hypothetical protein